MFYMFTDNEIAGRFQLEPYKTIIIEVEDETTAKGIVGELTGVFPDSISDCSCSVCRGKTYFEMKSGDNLYEVTYETRSRLGMSTTYFLRCSDVLFMTRINMINEIESWYNLHNLQEEPF